MTDTTKETWASHRGFLLAALGASVGLGNVWRFSYVAGENGGGAFLLVYLLMVLLIGVPLLLGELVLGRASQMESAAALRVLAPATRWKHVGVLGVVAASVILAYYAVIAGWVLRYMALYVGSTTHQLGTEGYANAFNGYVQQALQPLLWQLLCMALAMAVIVKGVQRGIEQVSLMLMPALALLLLGLAVYGATLPGFAQAAAFLFSPDWSALLRPQVYLAALGQAFFSIGLAMGVMITYGSYLPRTQNLPRAALTIALGDTLFAITAGLMIFPAVFSYGLDPAQGPGLAFVVLPEVFAQMPGGALVGAAFFLLLSIAALTSMVALLEVPVAWAMQRLGWSRLRACLGLGVLLYLLGVPASLGFGVWHDVQLGGQSILDTMDFIAVDLLLPLSGLLLALFIGWVWAADAARSASDLQHGHVGRVWRSLLRYLVPLLMVLVLLGSFLGSGGH